MHIYINHELKRALISFPKVAGTSIENILLWRMSRVQQAHPNINGWKLLQSDNQLHYFNLGQVKAIIPSEYQTTVMYRDPMERYISGFNFLFLDHTQMDMLNISDDGVDPTDDSLCAKWAKYNDEWYFNWAENIFLHSNYNPGLNDNHTMNIMMIVWILWWELDAQLLYINDLNDWIKAVHDIPNDFVLQKSNVSEYGYSKGNRKNVVNLVSAKFRDALKKVGVVEDYLRVDKFLFERIHNKQTKIASDHEQISFWLVNQLFSDSYPINRDMLSGFMTMHSAYLSVLTTWANEGSTMSNATKEQINTHIIQLTQRYKQLTLSTGDTDV